jgi:hypothetical protein
MDVRCRCLACLGAVHPETEQDPWTQAGPRVVGLGWAGPCMRRVSYGYTGRRPWVGLSQTDRRSNDTTKKVDRGRLRGRATLVEKRLAKQAKLLCIRRPSIPPSWFIRRGQPLQVAWAHVQQSIVLYTLESVQ